MRIYHNPAGTPDIRVLLTRSFYPLRKIVALGNGDLTWGDNSNEANDTALSILADYFEHEVGTTSMVAYAKACWLSKPFRIEVVSNLQDSWTVSSDQIKAFVARFPECDEEIKENDRAVIEYLMHPPARK